MDDVEECSQAIHFVQFARQGRGQIEAEAIHVHFQHPVAQAVHDQLQHARMLHVQRVAGAGVVHVVARIVGNQAVVGAVVDALQRKRRAEMVALRGMVVDDVENHFQSRRVQGLDHGFEFVDGVGRADSAARAQESQSSCIPSSCAVRAPPVAGRRRKLCTGISSIEVTPEPGEVVDDRRSRQTRHRSRAGGPGHQGWHMVKPLTWSS